MTFLARFARKNGGDVFRFWALPKIEKPFVLNGAPGKYNSENLLHTRFITS
jgi:hypothetical protein